MQSHTNRFTSLATKSLLLFAMLPVAAAHAVAISSDISISGSTTYATVDSFGSATGDFGVTVGGTTTLSAFTGATVGTNPLSGTLTDVDDGFGFSSSVTASDEAFDIGLDTTITLSNSSATDTYDVVFKITFDNAGDAGLDGYIFSDMTIDVDGAEIFFTHLESDTLFGDFLGDRDTGLFDDLGTAGESVTDFGMEFFTVTMGVGASASLIMEVNFEGEDFLGGVTTGALSGFLSVDSVTSTTPPVSAPAPGILLLLLTGLLAFPLARKLFR